MKYVLFLRGINVGGNKKVPMQELKKCFEEVGYQNVKTLLNTGNIIFESNKKIDVLRIEKTLQEYFGFPIPAVIYTKDQIEDLIKKNPFKNIEVTKDTRLYVTFLSDKPKSTLNLPYISPSGDFKILEIIERAVISVLVLSETMKTIKSMDILEKEYGKSNVKVTTRNWNTVEKIRKLL